MMRLFRLTILLGLLLVVAGCGAKEFFEEAVPVWGEGRETEMNLTMLFRAELGHPGDGALLKIAASTIYRARLNDEFLARGPARGPHGYYRVDEIELSGLRDEGENILVIEVAGYNCNSYQLLDQPSFLQAEVTSDGRVLAATGPENPSFEAFVFAGRLQKVQRFSFQRTFTEAYRYQGPDPSLDPVQLVEVAPKAFLQRGVLYPSYTVHEPRESVAVGRLVKTEDAEAARKDRSLADIGPEFKGFPEKELEICPSQELQIYTSKITGKEPYAWGGESVIELENGDWEMLDFGRNLTGFLGLEIECREPADLRLMFDEVLNEKGDIDPLRQGQVRILVWMVAPGEYRVEAMEPYTMRYVKAAAFEGAVRVRNIYMREYAHPELGHQAGFRAEDERLNRIFQAGVETFRQNSLDIFMDCPSRERAGWLCDSFFTARVEYDLTGESRIEDAFFQNFQLPPSFDHLPEGMVPMCYPADHYNGNFIPNWALWFIVQLEEYAARTSREERVEMLEERVMGVLDYFSSYENRSGLLESLDGWVFVEWSKANDWVQDLNYPTNMLYAGALDAAARLYGRPDLAGKAETIREAVREQSYDGEFFVDNAVRGDDGKLQGTGNHSEVCQYFAFYFEVASPESYPELWARLLDEFGPERVRKGIYPAVAPANSFIGNMIRMELLSEAGRSRQIMDESVEYLLYMAERTGTLWENDHANASTNHGFASHACHSLLRDLLGLAGVDRKGKSIVIRFADIPLEWCEGFVPTPEGEVRLAWRKVDGRIEYRLVSPDSYEVELINDSGLPLEEVRD